MLTDVALKNLRPKPRPYKSTDRDGLYAYVSPGGAISFRYDYRFNGRRETLTLGRYGRGGLSLAQARERLFEIKRTIAGGASPAIEKQRAKRRLKEATSFEHVANRWMDTAPMADSTRNMRRSIFNREVLPHWRNRLLSEITPGDLRAHCKSIVDRGAPATAIHVRDIVKQIYAWAILHGEKIDNPADGVGPASIATFRPRDRASRSLSTVIVRALDVQLRHAVFDRLGHAPFHRGQADPVSQSYLGVCHTVKAAQDEDVSVERGHGLKNLLELKAVDRIRRYRLGRQGPARCRVISE